MGSLNRGTPPKEKVASSKTEDYEATRWSLWFPQHNPDQGALEKASVDAMARGGEGVTPAAGVFDRWQAHTCFGRDAQGRG